MSKIENVSVDLSAYALKENVQNHINDTGAHVDEQKQLKWDKKSEFSGDYNDLRNLPNINTDEADDTFIICDKNGCVIMKVNASGVDTTAIFTNGKTISLPEYNTADEGKTLKIVNGVPAWV